MIGGLLIIAILLSWDYAEVSIAGVFSLRQRIQSQEIRQESLQREIDSVRVMVTTVSQASASASNVTYLYPHNPEALASQASVEPASARFVADILRALANRQPVDGIEGPRERSVEAEISVERPEISANDFQVLSITHPDIVRGQSFAVATIDKASTGTAMFDGGSAETVCIAGSATDSAADPREIAIRIIGKGVAGTITANVRLVNPGEDEREQPISTIAYMQSPVLVQLDLIATEEDGEVALEASLTTATGARVPAAQTSRIVFTQLTPSIGTLRSEADASGHALFEPPRAGGTARCYGQAMRVPRGRW